MAKNFLSGLFGKKKSEDPTPKEAPASTDAHEEDHTGSSATETIASVESADTTAPPPEEPAAKSDQSPVVDAPLLLRRPLNEAPGAEPEQPASPEEKQKSNWFTRLTQGLSKSSSKLSDGVASIFTKKKLDSETFEELEELLITADLGLPAAERITDALAQDRFDKEISEAEVQAAMAEEIASTLTPLQKPLTLTSGNKPHVVLMIGVNGAGKTTTIGKLAQKFSDQGLSVMLAAGDTFRAAAIEQLSVWGERTNSPVIARDVGADAAGLAFDALKQAQENNADVLLIDTAGRLQNKRELMDELAKIVRVLKKVDETAPHDVVLVLDATVGQNALSQTQQFSDIAGVTGLIMTKLDGTARGGVLVALADKFALPIHFIGVGEGVDDLQTFEAKPFSEALAGIGE